MKPSPGLLIIVLLLVSCFLGAFSATVDSWHKTKVVVTVDAPVDITITATDTAMTDSVTGTIFSPGQGLVVPAGTQKTIDLAAVGEINLKIE